MTARTAGTMLTSTAMRKVGPSSLAAPPSVSQTIRAAMPTPTKAPAVSPARCIPKARPRCFSSMLSATRASRGAVRTPLPNRSATRTPSTQPQALAMYRKGLAMVEMAYPSTVSPLRWPSLSERAPEYIFIRLAVVSAKPSIRPMMAVVAPSTLARKSGTRLKIISEETSVRNEVTVTTQTLRGKWRRPNLGVSAGWVGSVLSIRKLLLREQY